MKQDELEKLITPAQAARLRNVSVQAVVNLMDRGKLPFITIAGKRFLKTADVLSYKPNKGGRPVGSGKTKKVAVRNRRKDGNRRTE